MHTTAGTNHLLPPNKKCNKNVQNEKFGRKSPALLSPLPKIKIKETKRREVNKPAGLMLMIF